MQRLLIIIISCVLMSSCVSNNTSQYDYMSEDQLYETARQYMIARKFTRAAQAYQLLESRYPFGQYAEQAQLEIITAYYQGYEYELAVAAADRFVRLHPDHPEVDFAYYYRGLSNFDANRTLFDRFFKMDMSKRDPGAARDAFNDFSVLVSRYPESKFAADAQARMIYLRNLMARHEVHVANYYLKREAFTAAANRGRFVVEHYQGTKSVADGLAIMVQAYQKLGMANLANDSFTVLKSNFPKHEAIKDDGSFDSAFSLEDAEDARGGEDSSNF